MIICVDEEYLSTIGEEKSSELYCCATINGHLIDGMGASLDLIKASVDRHASTFQKEIIRTGKAIKLTKKLRQFLTTLQASQYEYDDLIRILSKPSKVLVENSVYEAPVYDNIIQLYCSDRIFGNLFAKLKLARNENRLVFDHSGGCGSVKGLLEQANADEYKSIAKYKFCTIIDRDADGPEYTKIQNIDKLLFFLAGKDSKTIRDSDIYTLNQPVYIWHMWYKREIENYFPNDHFERVGTDIAKWSSSPEDRNYKDLSCKGTGYHKNKLKDLVHGMSREKYEEGIKHFSVNDLMLSEFQILLLKFVKLI